MKSIVLCGSRKFKKEIRELATKLRKNDVTVYEPFLNEKSMDSLPQDFKRYAVTGLTLHHFELIRKADIAYFYNKGGYLGVSGSMELGAASVLNKPIIALEEDKTESCRNCLFDEVVSTISELLIRLK